MPDRAPAASIPRLCVVLLATLLGACAGSRGDTEADSAPPTEPAPAVQAEPEPEPAPEPQAEPEREPFAYTIETGDSLWAIALANDCSVAEIQAANGLEGPDIFAGQTLIIPPCTGDDEPDSADAEAGDTYTIQPGDYLELIAANVGCTVAEVMAANDLDSDAIYAGDSLQIPTCTGLPDAGSGADTGDSSFYVVQSGDVLGAIAERTGCAVSELMASNPLPNADSIRVGQRLHIPADCTGRPVSYTTVSFDVDHRALRQLMEARGFRPPAQFKALVVEITFDDQRQRVVGERRFDWDGTADDDTGWNPASSVKLFAGIAAAQYARDLGFTTAAEITFHGQGGDRRRSLRSLLEAALGPSDNIAYNELVQFVGYDRMNGQFLTGSNGIRRSALRRAYEARRWMEMGESSSFSASPAMTIREAGHSREVSARSGSTRVDCGSAACTSLLDLAEAMRRLMLQEQLPSSQHFDLPGPSLTTIRRALRTERRRGEEVVDELSDALGGAATFYHKAGFSQDWYSDVVYVSRPGQQAWIVALAGYPGRSSLNDAARIIGEILAEGALPAR